MGTMQTILLLQISLADAGFGCSSIKLWDLSRPTSALTTLRDAPGDVWSLSWRPTTTGSVAASSQPPIEGLRSAGLGGGMLVSGSEDGRVRWWRGTG